MYVRIPLRGLVNDTILNKPINQDGQTIGVITHYDGIYLYGIIWVKASIKIDNLTNSFEMVEVHSPWNAIERRR